MDLPDAQEITSVKGKITLSHVSFQYRPNTPLVLNDIDLIIQPGKTVALVGPTGAGKTTIANLIARFYEATEGTVLIDDKDIRSVTQQSLRRQVRVISQDPFLFSRTIMENIRYGMPEATDQQSRASSTSGKCP